MENLKALVKGIEMTPYQRALATREFVAMERRLNELEQQLKNCNLQNVNCCALVNEVRKYRKEQAELFEWTKKNGHPKMASFDEGGLNACDKLIAVIEKHCS